MLTELFLPEVPGVRVERFWREGATLHLAATTTRRYARCPLCRRRSKRVHSHYRRTIADLPCGAAGVCLHLRTRRFVCRVRWCRRKIFTERLPTLVAPWAQHTHRLRTRLEELGFALGGEPGRRHARTEGLRVSARTLIRLVRAAPTPASGPVRIVSLDDFALRKGQRYGTIIVNLETHRIIDLLPDRTVATTVAWLRAHPEITLISRDRASAYADAGRQGAPQARQVADRFHLVMNVTEALERYLTRHHAVLRQAAFADRETGAAAAEDTASGETDPEGKETPPRADGGEGAPATPPLTTAPRPAPLTRVQREQEDRRARRKARYEEVRALAAQGQTHRAIARMTGLGRATVERFAPAESFPERQPRPPRATSMTPYAAYLRERWNAGCHNADHLWRDLRAQGFTGSPSTVRGYVRAWRGARSPRSGGQTAPPPRPLLHVTASPRQTCWLLLRAEEDLTPDEQTYRTHLYHACPQIALAQALTREFRTLVRDRDVPGLYSWLHGLTLSAIPEFGAVARGIWMDRAAVEAALTEPWSQGQTEGKVNKLKTTKRALYGRSTFDLLRQRMLHAG